MGEACETNNVFFTKGRYEGVLAHRHVLDYARLS
jgi:hypothetical protein